MGTKPGAALAIVLAACGPSPAGEPDGAVRPDARPTGPDPDPDPTGDCTTLAMTVRDFSPSTHPDFEPFSDSDFAYPGLVEEELGSDGKPVYAHPGATPHTAGPAEFARWYNDTPGINEPFALTLTLTEVSPGVHGYDSAAFFPVDGQGFGNEGNPHNFHFTTEIHTEFEYAGGERFTFTGDDDLWLFIDERLAIDLGGLHPQLSATVELDTLGLTPGQRYRMDIFHAERHTDASNFHLETTIDCFVVD